MSIRPPAAPDPEAASPPAGETPSAGPVMGNASPDRSRQERSVRQIRHLMVTTALAFVLVLAFILLAVQQVTRDALVRAEEHANINLTMVIANALAERFRSQLPASDIFEKLSVPRDGNVRMAPHFNEVDKVIRQYARGTAIYRVKIYSHSGETLYSTDVKQVGVVNPLNEGVTAAIAGKVTSQLLHRDTFSTFDRETTDIDMVQSYIPGAGIGPGTDRLVFEVYSDVTNELADLRADQRRIFIILGLAMLVLYLALHLLVWWARSLLEQRSMERDQAYQHMAQAELELAQRKARFVAAAAHELRTPMTTIRGFSELLRDRPMEQPQLRDLADAINQQAEGMSQLLDELLDLSQFDEQGQSALRVRLQPLAPLVRAVVDNAKALGLPRSDMQVDVAPGLPELMIDAERIRQVLVNLISNACKYSGPQSPIRISLVADSAKAQQCRVGLRVEDAGCGILPDEVPYLFERFWRSPRVADIPGTGLGMPIVKILVELHGGSVEVASHAGQGTTVTVWLPCAGPDKAGQAGNGGEEAA